MFQNIPTLNKEDLLKGKSSDKDFKINIFENVESQIRGITVYFENTKFEICDLILKSSKPTLDSNLIEKVQKFDFKSVLSNVIYKFEDVEILIKEKCRKDSTSIYCQKKGDTLLYLKKT